MGLSHWADDSDMQIKHSKKSLLHLVFHNLSFKARSFFSQSVFLVGQTIFHSALGFEFLHFYWPFGAMHRNWRVIPPFIFHERSAKNSPCGNSLNWKGINQFQGWHEYLTLTMPLAIHVLELSPSKVHRTKKEKRKDPTRRWPSFLLIYRFMSTAIFPLHIVGGYWPKSRLEKWRSSKSIRALLLQLRAA